MCPSTEPGDALREFAAEVLRNLLQRIESENLEYIDGETRLGSGPIFVSHAWTEGPMMYLVFTAPPSDITWGLVRDTRESIIDPSPWPDLSEAVRYYYLLDLEENQPWAFCRPPGMPDTIQWHGYPTDDAPAHTSDIAEEYRYTPPKRAPSAKRRRKPNRPLTEPRRYVDPF